MRRTRRITFRLAIGLISFVVLAGIVCLDTVDHTPYVKTAYYQETRGRLQTTTILRGEILAGFGKEKLTPPREKFPSIPLAGYGDRDGKPAAGVHDDLFVKAVALRVGDRMVIMFGIDALIVPREVSDGATAQLGLPRESLYFSATHTHCSLGGWGEGLVGEAFAGKFDPAARAWMVECIVNAARAATNDLRPAEFGRASFDAPEFVRNRLVGKQGKVDPEFSLAVLKQRAGKQIILGSYSAHATVLSGRVMEFSGDYPGQWQRAVEGATGSDAIFFAGGVGSHAPVAGAPGFEGAERMGTALAQRAVKALADVLFTNVVTFGTVGLEVMLPPLNVRLTDGVRLRPWAARQLLPASNGKSFLQAYRLHDQLWLSTPCDFSGEMALGIKEHFETKKLDAVVTSFNGDYIGYVIPLRYYHLNGYEPRVMSFYGPNVPEYLDELMRALGDALADGQNAPQKR